VTNKKEISTYLFTPTHKHRYIYIYIYSKNEKEKFIRTMTKLNIRDKKKTLNEEKSADVHEFTKYFNTQKF
jgi:hypothetical protein